MRWVNVAAAIGAVRAQERQFGVARILAAQYAKLVKPLLDPAALKAAQGQHAVADDSTSGSEGA